VPAAERFEVYIYIADAKDGEDLCRYTVQHWFADRPDIDTIAALFAEAKLDFATLFLEVEPENFDVEVRRLRPQQFTFREAEEQDE
jgi:hypothetical protein